MPMTADGNRAIDRLWGCGEIDAVFNGAITTGVPWPSAGRLKGEPKVPEDGVDELVAAPARLIEVDPRELYASQSSVVRTHARYYLTGKWEITGRTSADMGKLGNRYPTFAERRGQLVILSGHHRSLAALIEGRPVLARVVDADATGPVSITPHLRIADDRKGDDRIANDRIADDRIADDRIANDRNGDEDNDAVDAPAADGLDALVARLTDGERVTVRSATDAMTVLRRVGLDDAEIADRFRHAGLGPPLADNP